MSALRVFTTHYMDEADLLCDRILVIDDGAIVSRGTPEELKRSMRGDAVSLTFPQPRDAARVAEIASRLEGATEPSMVDGTRAIFKSDVASTEAVIGFAITAVLVALGVLYGTRRFRRESA